MDINENTIQVRTCRPPSHSGKSGCCRKGAKRLQHSGYAKFRVSNVHVSVSRKMLVPGFEKNCSCDVRVDKKGRVSVDLIKVQGECVVEEL